MKERKMIRERALEGFLCDNADAWVERIIVYVVHGYNYEVVGTYETRDEFNKIEEMFDEVVKQLDTTLRKLKRPAIITKGSNSPFVYMFRLERTHDNPRIVGGEL